MATDTESIFYIVAIAAGLYLYSDAKRILRPEPLTTTQAASLIAKAGYTVQQPNDSTVRVEVPGGYYSWTGTADLRRWERGLLIADRLPIFPGTWLSRGVFE